MSASDGPGRSQEPGPAPKFSLAANRLRIVLLIPVTLALTALFLRAWTRVPERPWFPLLALLTLGLGAVAIRMQTKRLHTLRAVPETGLLQAEGTGQGRTWPLGDITALHLAELRIHAAAFADVGISFIRTTTIRRRLELTIKTGDESLVVEAPFRYKRRRLRHFSEELATLTGIRLGTSSRTEGRRTRPALMRFARPESLNPDTGSMRAGAMFGLVGWVLGVMTVLFAAPIAAMDPPYESGPVATADAVEDRFEDALTGLGAHDLEPVPLDAGFTTRDCQREEAWFWGGSHGVASLEFSTSRPVDTATGEAVLARVDEFGSLYTYNDRRGRVGGFLVEVSDGRLKVSGGTACLSSGDREELRPVVTDALGRIVTWLTTPS